jgi:hypothetical protein
MNKYFKLETGKLEKYNIDPNHCPSSKLLIKEAQDTEAGLLNESSRLAYALGVTRSSCLAPTLGVTKFVIVRGMLLFTVCCAN